MNAQDHFLVLMALISVGAFGWGDLTLRALRLIPRVADGPGDEDLGAPMKVAVGVALYLVVGGFAVAVDAASFGPLLGWQIAGFALALSAVVRRLRQRSGGRISWRLIPLGASAGLLGLMALGAALTGPYNGNDDGPAYLYLAQRLLSTGGLIDRFNERRLISYGGAELFLAPVLRVAGSSAGLGVEWFFFALLLIALVARSARRPFVVGLVLVVGIGVLAVRPIGLWANTAPTFSGAALTIALLQVLRGTRKGVVDLGRFALAGIFLAALLSLRLEFFVAGTAAAALSALVIVRGKSGLTSLGMLVGSSILSLVGWAVALARSSGTPLFPLFTGYWTSAADWHDPSIHTLSGYLHRLNLEVGEDQWGISVLGAVALVLLVVLIGRRLGAFEQRELSRLQISALVLGFAAIGCAAELLTETVSLSGAILSDVGRYSAPSALACLLFGLDTAFEAATTRSRAIGGEQKRPTPRTSDRLFRVGVAVAAFALFACALGATLPFYLDANATSTPVAGGTPRSEISSGVSVLDGDAVFANRFAPDARFRINNKIPAGSSVLAAVDVPALLDFTRYRFATLDLPGGSSPPPGLPLNEGIGPLVAYLRKLGIDGILASSPRTPGLYNRAAWEATLTSGIYNYRTTAVDFVAWVNDLEAMNAHYRKTIKRAGPLEYIPLS